jgi:hypothetical protein
VEKQEATETNGTCKRYNRVKILSIVWYKVLPPQFGGQKGIAYFNHQLARHHPLVCVCSNNNEPADDLLYTVRPILPQSKWQFLQPSSWKKIKTTAIEEKATHIILEHPYHGIAAVKAAKASGAKLILHSHNIESVRFREQGKWWWRLLALYEKWIFRKSQLVLVKSQPDMDHAINHFGVDATKCMIVPFGLLRSKIRADKKEARRVLESRYGIGSEMKILLFGGTLDYLPNAKAVEAIYQQIVPALEKTGLPFTIIITGRNTQKSFHYLDHFTHPLVIRAGNVDDISLYFAGADIFINPVLQGGGVQTKNIEALANGLNLVAFTSMLEGIDTQLCPRKIFAVEKEEVPLAIRWKNFVEQIVNASRSNEPVPGEFFTQYDWKKIGDAVVQRLSVV